MPILGQDPEVSDSGTRVLELEYWSLSPSILVNKIQKPSNSSLGFCLGGYPSSKFSGFDSTSLILTASILQALMASVYFFKSLPVCTGHNKLQIFKFSSVPQNNTLNGLPIFNVNQG